MCLDLEGGGLVRRPGVTMSASRGGDEETGVCLDLEGGAKWEAVGGDNVGKQRGDKETDGH